MSDDIQLTKTEKLLRVVLSALCIVIGATAIYFVYSTIAAATSDADLVTILLDLLMVLIVIAVATLGLIALFAKKPKLLSYFISICICLFVVALVQLAINIVRGLTCDDDDDDDTADSVADDNEGGGLFGDRCDDITAQHYIPLAVEMLITLGAALIAIVLKKKFVSIENGTELSNYYPT